MCGIVGAVAERNVVEILLEGLKRLEYRGYDSAGVALLQNDGILTRIRRTGKVQELADAVAEGEALGTTGIAHTRWATHGGVTEANAHPHFSNERVAVVHNGIIENYEKLRNALKEKGYVFGSDTDTETIAHTVHEALKTGETLLSAVQSAVKEFHGAYGTVIMDKEDPSRVVVARSGSPLVIGLGLGENFIASDQMALLPVTRRFIFLEEGDVAEITRRSVAIFDKDGCPVEREVIESNVEHDAGDKGMYRHYMLKEIHEQPVVVRNTLKDRLGESGLTRDAFGKEADAILSKVKHVQIVACGTSYHAGMTARYWLEQYANVSCNVEIASEFRYRKSVVHADSLLITISQSGETADTLAALRLAKELGYNASLAICNVPGSSLVRESDLAFMTQAGAEIGVASTKAFTTQLTAFLMLTLALGEYNGMAAQDKQDIVNALHSLPAKLEETLTITQGIEDLAEEFADKHHSLFLGRGDQYPIAMEGALKLKEISYIHAEGYPAAEMKHGPIALIDEKMPVVFLAPHDSTFDKVFSNIQEVKARKGIIITVTDKRTKDLEKISDYIIDVPSTHPRTFPLLASIPLQLLAYHLAVLRGCDVDKPRNLAKSVTVE